MYIWAIILKLNFLKSEAASGKSPFNLSFDSQLCMEMLCFHSLFFELKNTTPAFQEKFQPFRNFVSKSRYSRHKKSAVIITWGHADLLSGEQFFLLNRVCYKYLKTERVLHSPNSIEETPSAWCWRWGCAKQLAEFPWEEQLK